MFEKESERGNALFLILIAVILFAALSYAVTKLEGGNTNNASKDKLSIEVSRRLNELNLASTVFTRLRLRGCTLDDIDQYSGMSAPKSQCAFFSNNGGDYPYTNETQYVLYPLAVPQVGSGKYGVSITILLSNLPENKSLCDYLNLQQGITHIIDISSDQFFSDSTSNFNEYNLDSVPGSISFPSAYNGKHIGCAGDSVFGGYVLYQIIEEH